MDVGDWRRRAGEVIDVGGLPPFSLRGRGRLFTRIGVILAAVLLLASTYYQVNADSVAVVQRFGRYVRTHRSRAAPARSRSSRRSRLCPSSGS